MKKTIIIFLISVLSVISYAADESKKESVEELLALMKADSMIDTIYSQMDQTMQGMARRLGVTPSEKKIFDTYMVNMVNLMKSEINWKKMKGPMVDLYLKHYTGKEIKDMVSFYKSDSGQSMVKKMPAVISDSISISQDMMKDFIPKMLAMSQELKKEIDAAKKGQQ